MHSLDSSSLTGFLQQQGMESLRFQLGFRSGSCSYGFRISLPLRNIMTSYKFLNMQDNDRSRSGDGSANVATAKSYRTKLNGHHLH